MNQARQPMVVGRRDAVASAMTASNMSLRELEVEAEVSRSTLSNVSRGQSAIAKDKAERVAKALGKPLAALFVHMDGTPLSVG